jgi:hypothetical protein
MISNGKAISQTFDDLSLVFSLLLLLLLFAICEDQESRESHITFENAFDPVAKHHRLCLFAS